MPINSTSLSTATVLASVCPRAPCGESRRYLTSIGVNDFSPTMCRDCHVTWVESTSTNELRLGEGVVAQPPRVPHGHFGSARGARVACITCAVFCHLTVDPHHGEKRGGLKND